MWDFQGDFLDLSALFQDRKGTLKKNQRPGKAQQMKPNYTLEQTIIN
jgi:hypothetical protein